MWTLTIGHYNIPDTCALNLERRSECEYLSKSNEEFGDGASATTRILPFDIEHIWVRGPIGRDHMHHIWATCTHAHCEPQKIIERKLQLILTLLLYYSNQSESRSRNRECIRRDRNKSMFCTVLQIGLRTFGQSIQMNGSVFAGADGRHGGEPELVARVGREPVDLHLLICSVATRRMHETDLRLIYV